MSTADDWERVWDERRVALESHLGPADGPVWHSLIPAGLGGGADVLTFLSHRPATVYVTADLTGGVDQPPNSLGQYELMICVPEAASWARNLISRLGTYTLENVIEPYETMDIGPSLPKPTILSAFFFVPYFEFTLESKLCSVLLCQGITSAELELRWSDGHEELLRLLQQAGVFPLTDVLRPAHAVAT